MGTSASSTGPNNQSPLIPSWAEQSPSVTVEPAQGTEANRESNEVSNEKVQHVIGKPAGTAESTNRFAGARREFGNYAKTGGSSSDLRRALKRYSKKGSGGGKLQAEDWLVV